MSRILLVEDDPWIADCYHLWLSQDGHDIRHSRDAQEALDMVDDELPDVIVLDLFLPFANGVQLLHTLRSHADLSSVPVILCSSALPEQLPDMAVYGVRRVLDKAHLGPTRLRRAVKEAMHASL
jgi:DNA-binding response OmpR family regulator